MKIRRYYGHDCNSHDGFNNGYYIDDDFEKVKDIDHAFILCKQVLHENFDVNEDDVTELDNGYEFITSYSDDDGNELSKEQFIEMNENKEVGGYRYVYVTFETEYE